MTETVLMATTVVDLVAVAGLAWVVMRGGREREVASAEQRATLGQLREEIALLLADAEARARALEETLGARERSLRALVRDMNRAESPAAESPARPFSRAFTPAADDDAPGVDPAEIRLRRELELRLGKGRLA